MNGVMAALWCAAIMGWMFPFVEIINRIAARPFEKRSLKRLFAVLFLGAGFTALAGFLWLFYRQTRTTPTESLYLTEAALILVGAFGIASWLRNAILYHGHRAPTCEVEHYVRPISWKRDLLDEKPAVSRLLYLPGNEQLDLDIVLRALRLPRLPKEDAGLSLVHLSDLHFHRKMSRDYYERLIEQAMHLRPDVYFFTGDLLDDLGCLSWIGSTLGRLDAPLGCYFVLGNHDYYAGAPAVRAALQDAGWVDIAGKVVGLGDPGDGILIAGSEHPWMGERPPLERTREDAFRILLSHSPDEVDFAVRNHVDLMLCGHVHGGQIQLPVIGPMFAPSRYSVKYTNGSFQEGTTYLHVSRGVSGDVPVRYHCRPEITRFVLIPSDPADEDLS